MDATLPIAVNPAPRRACRVQHDQRGRPGHRRQDGARPAARRHDEVRIDRSIGGAGLRPEITGKPSSCRDNSEVLRGSAKLATGVATAVAGFGGRKLQPERGGGLRVGAGGERPQHGEDALRDRRHRRRLLGALDARSDDVDARPREHGRHLRRGLVRRAVRSHRDHGRGATVPQGDGRRRRSAAPVGRRLRASTSTCTARRPRPARGSASRRRSFRGWGRRPTARSTPTTTSGSPTGRRGTTCSKTSRRRGRRARRARLRDTAGRRRRGARRPGPHRPCPLRWSRRGRGSASASPRQLRSPSWSVRREER